MLFFSDLNLSFFLSFTNIIIVKNSILKEIPRTGSHDDSSELAQVSVR